MTLLITHSPSFLSNTFTGAGTPLSAAQLLLDSSLSHFSDQACDLESIALMSGAGLLGKLTRIGILSSLSQVRMTGNHPFLNLISHAAALSVEAGTFTFANHLSSQDQPSSPQKSFHRDFIHHLINFTSFKIFGQLTQTDNLFAQHLSQSLAMMTGHQVGAALGFEENSHLSITEQFMEANISTLQMSFASNLGLFLSGGKIRNMERHLGENIISPSDLNSIFLECKRNPLTSQDRLFPHMLLMTDETPRARSFTDPLARISRPTPVSPLNTSEASKFERELNDFSFAVDCAASFSSFHLQLIFSENKEKVTGHLFLGHHYNMCGGTKGVLEVVEYRGRQEGIPDLTGMLSERINYFASRVLALESNGVLEAEKISKLRENVYTAYDQLQLMRETFRIYERYALPEEAPFYKGVKLAYKGLLDNSVVQAERAQRTIQNPTLAITVQDVNRWTHRYLMNTLNPQASKNVQIIRGRIGLVRGEHVGGDFYQALHMENTLPAFRPVRVSFDPENGQIVAFHDQSEASHNTVEAFRRRNIRLQEAVLWVDMIESGEIAKVQIYGDHKERKTLNALQNLVGLQVMPSSRIWAYENHSDSSQNFWSISFQWNLCEDPANQLYYLNAVSKSIEMGDGENKTRWRLFTFDPVVQTHGTTSQQLWVPESSFNGDALSKLVKLVKKS